eukprot:1157508-Pelagomonas_calceolata.AAC.1
MCAQGTRAMGFMDMTQEAEWSLCTRHNSRGCMDSDQGPAAVAAHPPVPCCIPAVHISLADSEYVHHSYTNKRQLPVGSSAHAAAPLTAWPAEIQTTAETIFHRKTSFRVRRGQSLGWRGFQRLATSTDDRLRVAAITEASTAIACSWSCTALVLVKGQQQVTAGG